MKAATVTLNPALDRTMIFNNDFRLGELNRAESVQTAAGGKGINVTRILKIMGVNAPAYGFCGGNTGIILKKMLLDEGLEFHFTETAADTRENIKLIGKNGVCTEANQSGGPIIDSEYTEICDTVLKNAQPGMIFFLGGSIPQGVDNNVYNFLINGLKTRGCNTILDCDGGGLKSGIKSAPSMIKPNFFELSQFCGKELNDKKSAVDSAYNIYLDYGVDVLCTLGGDGAFYAGKYGIFTVTSPHIVVRSFAGAGDTFLSAFTFEFERQMSLNSEKKADMSEKIKTALMFASSAASSRVEMTSDVLPDINTMRKFIPVLNVEQIR